MVAAILLVGAYLTLVCMVRHMVARNNALIVYHTSNGTPFAPHHYFWGIILHFVGFILVFYSSHWGWSILAFGLGEWIVWDDIIQHLKQRNNPDHTSFLHNLYWKCLCYLEEHTPPGWFKSFLHWLKTV